jgi:hypothetical protein
LTLDEIRRTPALADAGHKLANLIHLARRTPNP